MGSKTQPKKYLVTESELSMIAELSANTAIKAYEDRHKQEEKARQSRVLNSAKTLIMNYRRFKGMTGNAVYDGQTTTDDTLKEILELMQGGFRNSEFEVLSIKEKTMRTKMILDHVDTMLGVYKKQCENSVDPEESRRYRVIEGMYLIEKPKTVAELAEEEHVTERTIFRDRDIAYKRLAILFFGIDGVRF